MRPGVHAGDLCRPKSVARRAAQIRVGGLRRPENKGFSRLRKAARRNSLRGRRKACILLGSHRGSSNPVLRTASHFRAAKPSDSHSLCKSPQQTLVVSPARRGVSIEDMAMLKHWVTQLEARAERQRAEHKAVQEEQARAEAEAARARLVSSRHPARPPAFYDPDRGSGGGSVAAGPASPAARPRPWSYRLPSRRTWHGSAASRLRSGTPLARWRGVSGAVVFGTLMALRLSADLAVRASWPAAIAVTQ